MMRPTTAIWTASLTLAALVTLSLLGPGRTWAQGIRAWYSRPKPGIVVLNLAVPRPAPGAIIVEQHHPRGARLLNATPRPQKRGPGWEKWLLRGDISEKVRIKMRFSPVPQKAALRSTISYRHPVSGKITVLGLRGGKR